MVTLLYEMQKRNAKKDLATLCIGGGMALRCASKGDVKSRKTTQGDDTSIQFVAFA